MVVCVTLERQRNNYAPTLTGLIRKLDESVVGSEDCDALLPGLPDVKGKLAL